MPRPGVDLAAAVELTRTGDVWLFRGRSGPDRAIQTLTNSPVNHVGMSVVLDDLPPLMWHAELGASLPDAWTGNHQRGVQLHDLHDAVTTWAQRYGQQAWLRQLDPPVGREAEDAVMRTIARLDGTAFPSSAKLAGRWFAGRVPGVLPGRRRAGNGVESAYCAEVLAITYEAMGLLETGRKVNWYDPGRFWSGDGLELLGATLGPEITVDTGPPRRPGPAPDARPLVRAAEALTRGLPPRLLPRALRPAHPTQPQEGR
ncbi:hypothetical protein GCM10027047_37580 [Rhodococcus aerolatus]